MDMPVTVEAFGEMDILSGTLYIILDLTSCEKCNSSPSGRNLWLELDNWPP